MGGTSWHCHVCNEAQSKYKCPTCFLPYCSVVCFKKHKETPCAKPEPIEEKPKRLVDVDEPSDVLQQLQLEAIASSSEIHEALKDEYLQKLISDIDRSSDPINVNTGISVQKLPENFTY